MSTGGGAYVFIALCFGLAGGIVGKLKGSSFWLWFAISGLLPLFGLFAALAYRFDSDELQQWNEQQQPEAFRHREAQHDQRRERHLARRNRDQRRHEVLERGLVPVTLRTSCHVTPSCRGT